MKGRGREVLSSLSLQEYTHRCWGSAMEDVVKKTSGKSCTQLTFSIFSNPEFDEIIWSTTSFCK